MQRLNESILVVLGTLLCIGGAIGVWRTQLSAPAASLWPLPALVLLEWMLLGALGMIAAFGDRRFERSHWRSVRWLVCGALFGLLILGIFSIGPFVLLAALAFLAAVLLAEHEHTRSLRVPVGLLTAGTVGNVGLLITLLSLAHV